MRGRIQRADQVIVLCGKRTGNATGVALELRIARDLNKPYFLLAGRSTGGNVKPATATSSDRMYRWTWKNLATLVRGGR